MNTWLRSRPAYVYIIPLILVLLSIISYYVFYMHPGSSVNKIGQAAKQANLPVAAPQEAEKVSAHKNLPTKITIPEGAGHIAEGFIAKGKANKIVIHVQDIHTNYEAQKNLSRIVEALVQEKNLKLIMVEGGWGNVSLSYLRSYADRERRLEVAEEYLKEGKISGEEYLDIVSDYDIELEGLEDEALYKDNLNAFFEIEKFRKGATKELDTINAVVTKLKEKIYPQQVLELEKTKQDYEDSKASFAAYYERIYDLAKKTSQPLTQFSNFNDFIRVTESEKNIDFPAVEKERSVLIEKLSKDLSKQRLATLVTKSLEFRLNKLTPSEYHSYLMQEAQSAGEDLGRYQNLEKYVAYIKSHEDIDTNRLFEEAEELSTKIKDRLLPDARQKRLNEISNAARILDNFLNLRLIPNDFKYYKEHKNDFITAAWADFLTELAERNKLKIAAITPAYDIDNNLSSLVRFYEIANERDDVFVKNAVRLMNEKTQDMAIVITGGFHTPALKQKLAECGISYIVVAPHTTQQTDPDQYRYILKYKSGRVEPETAAEAETEN